MAISSKDEVVQLQEKQVGNDWDSSGDKEQDGEGVKTGTGEDAVDMHHLGRK